VALWLCPAYVISKHGWELCVGKGGKGKGRHSCGSALCFDRLLAGGGCAVVPVASDPAGLPWPSPHLCVQHSAKGGSTLLRVAASC